MKKKSDNTRFWSSLIAMLICWILAMIFKILTFGDAIVIFLLVTIPFVFFIGTIWMDYKEVVK
jgi:hypothetical protein